MNPETTNTTKLDNNPVNTEAEMNKKYGWSNEELKMSLIYQGSYLDFFPEDGSNRMVKSAARWDGHNKRVIVRATDGFVYTINNVNEMPSLEEGLRIQEQASTSWKIWYTEQINKEENHIPPNTTLH